MYSEIIQCDEQKVIFHMGKKRIILQPLNSAQQYRTVSEYIQNAVSDSEIVLLTWRSNFDGRYMELQLSLNSFDFLPIMKFKAE